MSLTNFDINSHSYWSYANILEADAFLQVDPVRGPVWALLTAEQKAMHLVAATRRIDLEVFPGEKTDPAQPLQWPRRRRGMRGGCNTIRCYPRPCGTGHNHAGR